MANDPSPERRAPGRPARPKAEPPPTIEYDDGVHLVGSVLWFDAPRERDLCFVSHARFARLPPHRKVLCSQATARLARRPLASATLLVSPYSHPFTLGDLTIELLPAGHMLGAAQARVERDDETVVYADSVLLAGTRTAEPAQVRRCDTLVVGCAYADPALGLPPRAEVEEAVVRWVGETLDAGRTPVLLTARVGKAQDLLALLAGAGVPVRAHRQVQEYTAIYREHGLSFPGVRAWRGPPPAGEAVVWPASLRRSPVLRRLTRPPRFAVCTGRAAGDPAGEAARHGADVAFPLTNHPDFEALARFVVATGARRVYLHRGPVEACAAALQARGVAAVALVAPEQLALV